MTRRSTRRSPRLLCLCSLALAAAASAGEDCATATAVAVPSTVTGDTTGAADDLSPPCTGSRTDAPDEVYSYTPAAAERIDVVLTPLAPDYDASLYVLSSCAPPVCAAGADAHGMGTPEQIEFLPLQAGVTYDVVVDGFPFFASSDHGPYQLAISRSVVPDDCATARAVPTVPWLDALDTSMGTDSAGIGAACPIGPQAGPDVVYRLVPDFTARIAMTLTPQGFDASLYALDGCTAGNCLGASDQPGAGTVEPLSLDVTAGVPIYIVVDDAVAGGPYTLHFQAGEICADPIVVTSFPFTARGDTRAAENDVDLTRSSCTGFPTNAPDVIYALAPARDAWVDLRLTPLDGAYDVSLYVIGDCAAADSSCVAGADAGVDGEAESVPGLYVRAGQTLYGVVDSPTFEAAPYELRIDPHPGAILFATKGAAGVVLRFAGDAASVRIERDLLPDFSSPLVLSASEPGPTFTDTSAGSGTSFYRVE